jgi:large subunit ribosomal protein L54
LLPAHGLLSLSQSVSVSVSVSVSRCQWQWQWQCRSQSTSPSSASGSPAPRISSSVHANTPLRGLNILKEGKDPVALPDDQYPSWLWSLLDGSTSSSTASTSPFAKQTILVRSKEKIVLRKK